MAKVKRQNPATQQDEIVEISPEQIQPGDVLVDSVDPAKPWDVPEVEKTVDQPDQKPDEVKTQQAEENQETVKQAVEQIVEQAVEMIVIYSKNKFFVDKKEGGHQVIEIGESTVPSWVAKHWYAISQGIKVIGKVEENSIKSALTFDKISLVETGIKNLVPVVKSLENIVDLSSEQEEFLDDLIHFVESSLENLDKFKQSIGE